MKKNVASQKIGCQMVSASDGSAFTGSVTVSVTVDAGTQATGSVGSGACTHEGNGYHTYAPAQAETNGDLVAFTFTGTGAIPATVQVYTSFPQTGDAYAETQNGTYGLSAIKGYVDDIGVAGAGLTAIPDLAGVTTLLSRIGGAITITSGRVNADVTHIATAAVSTSTAQLGVNVVNFGGSAGSFASGIPAVNATQLSGDGTAADNAESFFDGTGYAGTNNVIPTVTAVTGLTASNLDTTVSSRLATSGYTAPPSAASNATAVLTTAMTESYGTDGGTVTLAQGIYELLAFLQERSAAGTTLTVKKRDGSTTAYTLTLGDATDPTSITRAT